MKRVAIIGGGIVGSVAAFYLSRENVELTLYDDGLGQATKAAVGIICPWVSQRRNQWWYRLVDEGSIFYHKLIVDVEDASFYEKSGALLVNDQRLDKMYELALSRRHGNSIMGEIAIVAGKDLEALLPVGSRFTKALYIEGAARVDGASLVEVLQREAMASGMKRVQAKVSFERRGDQFVIGDEVYDSIILASGAWLQELLVDFEVDVRPQKGQLIEFENHVEAKQYPLYIPKGEIDILYKANGSVVVGASHEDDKGFDLVPDRKVLKHLQDQAGLHLPSLNEKPYDSVRVGTRAYSSDFLPYYGNIASMPQCFVASGLGSSGLTSGPLIGYRLAMQVLGLEEPSSTHNYIRPI